MADAQTLFSIAKVLGVGLIVGAIIYFIIKFWNVFKYLGIIAAIMAAIAGVSWLLGVIGVEGGILGVLGTAFNWITGKQNEQAAEDAANAATPEEAAAILAKQEEANQTFASSISKNAKVATDVVKTEPGSDGGTLKVDVLDEDGIVTDTGFFKRSDYESEGDMMQGINDYFNNLQSEYGPSEIASFNFEAV